MVNIFTNIFRTSNFLLYRFRYLINYIIIGFFSVLLEVLIVNQLNGIQINAYLSIALGFVSGVIFSFILNAKLNFKIPQSQNRKTFMIFLVISTIALFINLLLIEVFSKTLDIHYAFLRFISAACVFAISYIAHRKITFKFVKKVGIAIYLNRDQSTADIYSKIKYYGDFIHIDLLDKTFSSEAKDIELDLIKKIDLTWGLQKIIHIMSRNPSIWIKELHKHVDIIIFHFEINEDIEEIIKLCKKHGKKVGIAISNLTEVKQIIPFIDKVDFVQVMGIDTLGKSGQSFNPESLLKVEQLNNLRKKHRFEIIFDGGVKPTNIGRIQAGYIVSSSSLLHSDNPIRSFMELKTSSRYRDVRRELRKDIVDNIMSAINQIEGIDSGTIVGSFAESGSLEGISDIDIVIILDKLNKNTFDKVLKVFENQKKKLESKYGYPIYINSTFGPLKFHENNIVFHLMIYDTKSHKQHCLDSPFTCLDWQRSNLFAKKSLSDIYKVRALQPNFFFNVRRSMKDYINDLKKKSVSYRKYVFNKNGVRQEKYYKELNSKDMVEYSYHIMKFLMMNFLKLYYKENKTYNLSKTLKEYFKIFHKNSEQHKELIIYLYKLKNSHNYKVSEKIIKRIELFLIDFEEQFINYFEKESIKLSIFRHAKTKSNKENLFVGQKSDPGIIPLKNKEINELNAYLDECDIIYSSPSKRCLETLKNVNNNHINIDGRLKEIDYGLIDGKDLSYLSEKFPEIIMGWNMGKDMRFPEGENNNDILHRALSFIKDISKSKKKSIGICTHNAIIRALIGYCLKIPQRDWYKLNIPYAQPLHFIITKDNKFISNLYPNQLKEVMKNFPNG